MRLMSNSGEYVNLELVRYEYPLISDPTNPYDQNWLRVRLDANTLDIKWAEQYPCLLTWEVEELARFLRTLAGDKNDPQFLEFMEPNLAFNGFWPWPNSDSRMLQAKFDLEFHPQRNFRPCSAGRPYIVELTMLRGALLDAANSLEDELRKFPPRGNLDFRR